MLDGKGDADELRSAAAEEREAINRLLAAARRIAAEDDRKINPATFDRVGETLQAAGPDQQLAELVRAGRLVKEARSATIGASPRAPKRGRAGGRASRASEKRAERERARGELERAERDLKLAEQRRGRAEDRVEEQSERLKQARADLAQARRDAKRLAAEVRRAEGRLAKLKK